jgi:hypothetical protein
MTEGVGSDGLQTGRPSSILSGVRNLSVLHSFHTGFGAHSASNSVGIGLFFP